MSMSKPFTFDISYGEGRGASGCASGSVMLIKVLHPDVHPGPSCSSKFCIQMHPGLSCSEFMLMSVGYRGRSQGRLGSEFRVNVTAEGDELPRHNLVQVSLVNL